MGSKIALKNAQDQEFSINHQDNAGAISINSNDIATLSGNQTVTGVKNYTSSPTAPTATAGDNSAKLATTAYVDGKMVLGIVVNATGTSIDFTGIPSWAKRITVMFNGVSTNGASEITMRGGAGSIETTGYTGATSSSPNATTPVVNTWSNGATIITGTSAASLYYGAITLSLINGNTWTITGSFGRADALQISLGGSKTFSGVLDRVRITTVNGTDTFDSGSINIMYEG